MAQQRQIRSVMTPNPRTVSPDSNVVEVASIMRDQDTGVVPVVEGKKIVGLITDRDIVVRALAAGKDCSSLRVNEVMTRDLRTVKEDASLDEVLNMMSRDEIRRIPVVNQSNELVGIVSIGDLAKKTDRDDKVGKAVEQISEAPPNN
jgi:CBS domain-containing protein